jgi:polyisoprenoid-binding protein YceI
LALTATLGFQSCTSNTEEETTTDEVASVQNGTFGADLTSSSVKWKGVMLGIKEHTGNVTLSNAEVTITDGAVTGGTFTVDLSTINTNDSSYNAENTPEKLVGHLSSADFFNIAEFPTATFVVTGSEGTNVTGNLIIRGITYEETVKNVEIHTVADITNVRGTLTFDRKKYEVAFDMPMKDMVISNDIELTINLVLAE